MNKKRNVQIFGGTQKYFGGTQKYFGGTFGFRGTQVEKHCSKYFIICCFFGYRDTGMDLTPYLYPEIKLFTVKTLKQIQ
jgi:hypothetical protein